ncbi:uncharacterized protein KY384_007279 [Bacidia gigantensis]|uniref:uncharacterized protein n=1 Tax=Bacidia gigantensis TaxID=2732470 RepID=UPI001D04BACC|nr:uncharacterized protein KY384_007279 [Bacidia gigantensis]KAG8528361.1 hypothetical protein KY384_007279 [Bacidia gigantensis]
MASRLKSMLSSATQHGQLLLHPNVPTTNIKHPAEHLWTRPPPFLAPALRSSLSTTSHSLSPQKQKPHQTRLFRQRKSAARKEANLSRRATLTAERTLAQGDPIRGIPTPFLRSLINPISDPAPSLVPDPADKSTSVTTPDASSVDLTASSQDTALTSAPIDTSDPQGLTHGLTPSELTTSLQRSRFLTATTGPEERKRETYKKRSEADEARHTLASEAVSRIVSLSNASNLQRRKRSAERVIEAFGRHNTDSILTPKPAAAPQQRRASSSAAGSTDLIPVAAGNSDDGGAGAGAGAGKIPRAGPDTGSSEVQIGMLTLKINALADAYASFGKHDKVNKRNLRLLLHRRQKLCRYLMRKERGGPRWRNLVEKLGLGARCWEGEIEVR